MAGKYPAKATPISALAWRIVSSAAATSGLRSSSDDGRPTGIEGIWLASGPRGIESPAGGRPISAAIACSLWARDTPAAMSCAWALSTSACAVMTSDLAAVPAAYWFWVIFSERL